MGAACREPLARVREHMADLEAEAMLRDDPMTVAALRIARPMLIGATDAIRREAGGDGDLLGELVVAALPSALGLVLAWLIAATAEGAHRAAMTALLAEQVGDEARAWGTTVDIAGMGVTS